MDLVIWGLILLAAAVLIVVLELFVPTAGAAVGHGGGAGPCGHRLHVQGRRCVGVLVVAGGDHPRPRGVRLCPAHLAQHAPGAERIIGMPSDEQVEQQKTAEEEARREREALIGAEGIVLTDLRPLGVVEVNGRRYDARSESRFIQTGSRIRVSHVDGLELKVRPLA